MTQATNQPDIRQEFGEANPNSINVEQSSAQQLIDAINTDLASLFVLFHQYQKHHWVVQGPQFRDLHLLLQEHYTATHMQADEFAERIVTLGGAPVSSMAGQIEHAYIEEEPEGVLDVRQMLSNDLHANQKILVSLREHVRLARDFRDFGTEQLLKRHLREQEIRTQDLMHLLEHETLDEVLATQ
jgi:starvation-inducible DNA-binding protein